jgi:hypothetical protein
LNHRFLVNVTLRKYCGISYNVYEVVPWSFNAIVSFIFNNCSLQEFGWWSLS